MKTQHLIGFCAAAAVGALVLTGTSASALTMKECSAKYKEAQKAGTAKDVKWNDFRKAQCGSDATAAKTDAPKDTKKAKDDAKETKAAAKEAAAANPDKPAKGAKPAAGAAPAASGPAVFPTAVSSKYSSESAGKARMHTCLDQYKANKDNGGNGGLVWIKKGGGYYSECNKRLSG